jgi:hypothetical protein
LGNSITDPRRKKYKTDLAQKIREIAVHPFLELVTEERLLADVAGVAGVAGVGGRAAVGAEGVERVSEGVYGVANKVLVVLRNKQIPKGSFLFLLGSVRKFPVFLAKGYLNK